MSFEIYVGAFENEGRYRFPVANLRLRFSEHTAREDEYGFWHLAFSDGPCTTTVSPSEGDPTTGFTVHRPPDYLAFWEIIAGVLRDLPCVLYWPGGGAIVGSLDQIQHLPEDMVETLGVPWVSTDPGKIRQLVWQNS